MTMTKNWYFLCNNVGHMHKRERFAIRRPVWSDGWVCLYLLVCFHLFSVYIRGAPCFQSQHFCSLLSPRSTASLACWTWISSLSVPPWDSNKTIYTQTQVLSHCNHVGPELIVPLKTTEQWLYEKGVQKWSNCGEAPPKQSTHPSTLAKLLSMMWAITAASSRFMWPTWLP